MRQDIASHSHHGRLRAVFVFAASFLLLTGGNAYAQGSVATDRAALVALYNATDGANWTNNTNWLSNEALSKWYGIGTDASGRVEQLSLSQNELSGTIPVELGNLTNLQRLSLWNNELSGTIPVELGNLTNLQRLSLWNNELSGTIPVELGNLTSLRSLYLWSNELSGAIPAELGNLTSLQQLYLNQNELSGPLPLTLSALSQLSVLDIRSISIGSTRTAHTVRRLYKQFGAGATNLCAPLDTAFQVWLETINFQGAVCVAPPPSPPSPPPPPRPGTRRRTTADLRSGITSTGSTGFEEGGYPSAPPAPPIPSGVCISSSERAASSTARSMSFRCGR